MNSFRVRGVAWRADQCRASLLLVLTVAMGGVAASLWADDAQREFGIIQELQQLDAQNDFDAIMRKCAEYDKAGSDKADPSMKVKIHALKGVLMAKYGQSKEGREFLVREYHNLETDNDRKIIIGRLSAGMMKFGLYRFAYDTSSDLLPLTQADAAYRSDLRYIQIFSLALAENDWHPAIELAKSVADTPVDSDGAYACLKELWSFYSHGDAGPQKALEVMVAACAVFPALGNDARFLHNRGAQYFLLKRWEAAYDDDMKAASLTANKELLTHIYWGLASVAGKLGRRDESRFFLDKCEEVCKNTRLEKEFMEQIGLERRFSASKCPTDAPKQ